MIKERPPAENKDQIIANLQQQLAQEQQDHDQVIDENAQLKKENQQLRTYKTTVHTIVTNRDMTYSDRVLWIITLDNHPNEMINCKPFQPNISRLRQQSGVGTDTATKFFGSMVEAGAIKYTNKPQQDENHTFSSVSTIIPLADHTQANTKAATLRIKQREEVTKRRLARKLITTPCENCNSENPDDAYSAIVPVCKSCNHVTMDQQLMVLAKDVRIIEETIIPPSHEFSEVTDHEWEEEENSPSHEFSETPTVGDTDTQTKNITPSHEFSEGMIVDTPAGIGTISLISYIRNEMRCGVILPSEQPDGSRYAVFSLHEIQLVIQSSLVEEER